MSRDQALRKLYNRLLVKQKHGLQKGAQCAPAGHKELQKSLARIGLSDTVPPLSVDDLLIKVRLVFSVFKREG